MIKVGYSDQLFYLRPKEPRNLRIKIVLKEKLNLDFLKKAVNETLELLPEFKIQVKLIDGELWKEPNDNEVVFAHFDEPAKYLGSKDTAGYPFLIKYDDFSYELSINHSLTDFSGMWNFLKTITIKYVKKCGLDIDVDEYEPFDIYDDLRHNPYSVFAKRDNNQYFVSDGPCFKIPEEPVLKEQKIQRVYSVDVKLTDLLNLKRRCKCSTTCMVGLITAMAIYYAYDKPKERIIFRIPIDMRSVYKINTNANFSEAAVFELTKEDFEGDFASVANRLTDNLKEQLTTENFNNHMANNINSGSALREQLGLEHSDVLFPPKADINNPTTFATTYPGAMYISKDCEALIADILPTAFVPLNPLKFTAKSYADNFSIFCNQEFEGDHVVKALVDAYAKLGIDAKIIDYGYTTSEGYDINLLK